ncbi:recombinase family protein [Paenibacillus sp. PL91]|uniref:recombinase family protein n=1 Tax=Paenibacillus sp. PL91 TaxID=2729538 RepID=UPI00145E0C3B|nr:recombinase family protein [Paenibacillus sp. PL91]MBC9204100.1 recombinase family protein [Paenibacillus sp. PL91]
MSEDRKKEGFKLFKLVFRQYLLSRYRYITNVMRVVTGFSAILAACFDYLRPEDTLVVYKLDRLGRSTAKLVNLVDDLHKRDITFASTTDKIDTSTSAGYVNDPQCVRTVSDLIRERTRDGLEAARARGHVGGRPSQNCDKLAQALKLHVSKQYTINEIRDMTGVTKSVLYRALQAQS